MKTLLILRHAKTQSDAPAGDHARQLTERGLRDAESMAAYIQRQIGGPDAIITSDARRAMQTAEIVSNRLAGVVPLTVEPHLYAAGLDTLLGVVRALPDAADRVVLIGHNPGLEELAAALSSDDAAVRMPTAALAHLEFAGATWRDVQPGSGRVREVATRHTIA